jgi:hypothetical protein
MIKKVKLSVTLLAIMALGEVRVIGPDQFFSVFIRFAEVQKIDKSALS